jgi:heme exporter protein A
VISALHISRLALTRGDRLLFEGLSAVLIAGEALALTGRNGAGKTSLLRAIAGLIRPAEGTITFEGAAGTLEPEEARAGGLHLLGHHDGLKSGRLARDELRFQARWTGATAEGLDRAYQALDLHRIADLEVRKLSAGQRRRLALGRLIAAPRPLWLLDEPFAPLDAGHRAAFGALMAEHMANGGLIVAAVHDPLPIATRALEVGA